jgi:hypothetical protein
VHEQNVEPSQKPDELHHALRLLSSRLLVSHARRSAAESCRLSKESDPGSEAGPPQILSCRSRISGAPLARPRIRDTRVAHWLPAHAPPRRGSL